MKISAFGEWVKTPKGKLFLALGVMFLSWIFLFLHFSSSLMISLPSAARKAEIKQEIRKLRTELQNLNEKKTQAEKQKKSWQLLAEKSWQPNRDGDPELLLRQMIENAARKSELKLNNLGTVRITRINQDFAFAELDISSNTTIAPLAAFIQAIQQLKPAVSWRRLMILSMMRRPRNNTRTVSANTADDNLMLNGNLRTLIYYPENGVPPSGGGKAGRNRNAKQTAAESGGDVLPTGNPPRSGGTRGGGPRP